MDAVVKIAAPMTRRTLLFFSTYAKLSLRLTLFYAFSFVMRSLQTIPPNMTHIVPSVAKKMFARKYPRAEDVLPPPK